MSERKFNIKCPRCGSRDVCLAEQFTVWDDHTIRNGVLIETHATVRPSVTNRLVATCDGPRCDYQWTLRRSIHEIETEERSTTPPDGAKGER